MKKILLVKTSSLGDVVHNFPVVGDIRRHFPDACIDWAVEEAYAPLVQLNRAVHRAIPVAVRRWRSHLFAPSTWRQIGDLRRQLRDERYDLAIDTQGLLKSALIIAAADGNRHGFDAASAREAIAARFYDTVHSVARDRHAVERNRELVAAALGCRSEGPADFGLSGGWPGPATEKYVVFLHSTSRADKEWPEQSWISLGTRLEHSGFRIVLPWGGKSEQDRAVRIAGALARAQVPQAMSLMDMAHLLAGGTAVVGLDTGLAHLAAALAAPVVALYCATEPGLTGIYGCARCINLGGIGRPPSPDEVVAGLKACGVL